MRAIWWWTCRVVRWRDAGYAEGALRERWRDCTVLHGEFSAMRVMSLTGVARFVWGWAGLVTSTCGVASRGEGRVRWCAECRTGSDGAASGEGGYASVESAFGSAQGRKWGAERRARVCRAMIACRRIAGPVVAAVTERSGGQGEFCDGVPGRAWRDDGGARRLSWVMQLRAWFGELPLPHVSFVWGECGLE